MILLKNNKQLSKEHTKLRKSQNDDFWLQNLSIY